MVAEAGYPATPGEAPIAEGAGPEVDPFRPPFFFPLPLVFVVLAGGIDGPTPFMVAVGIRPPGGIPPGMPGGTPFLESGGEE